MMPPVVKNLLIINVLVFLAQMAFESSMKVNMVSLFGLHYISSPDFQPWQFVTYMFLHGDISHLFFNMFALWMFGYLLENVMGAKRFLFYYFATGVGAAFMQIIVAYLTIQHALPQISAENLQLVYSEGRSLLQSNRNFVDPAMGSLNAAMYSSTIGASGAVFGILLAFGMFFPNQLIYVFFAIPVKAKWFVIGYGVVEFFMGVANRAGDNVAHFAHLGGMIFGFILLMYWRKKYQRR